MQIIPYYNNDSHIEFGVYFKVGTDQSSAYGSNFIIINVPTATLFSLTYNSASVGIEGAAAIAILKLSRSVTN